jgi:hypothetical protein
MAISWIVFVLVFGSAIAAIYLHRLLPEHHVITDSKDVVKLAIALIATMAALVLSLLISSAKSSYDTRSNQVVQMSAEILVLDRLLAHYGAEAADARNTLRRTALTLLRPTTIKFRSMNFTTKSQRYSRRMMRIGRCAVKRCRWSSKSDTL